MSNCLPIFMPTKVFKTSLVAQTVKASAYNAGDPGSIPGLGRSSGEGNSHSSTLAWKIPWTEECDRLQSMGHKESDSTERLHFHFSECYCEDKGRQ